jgi:Tfp pilus assembly protein PilN
MSNSNTATTEWLLAVVGAHVREIKFLLASYFWIIVLVVAVGFALIILMCTFWKMCKEKRKEDKKAFLEKRKIKLQAELEEVIIDLTGLQETILEK